MLSSVLLSAGACAPAEIPDMDDQPDLEELCLDFFSHFLDDDPGLLQDGVLDLLSWMDTWGDDTREGYQVAPLDAATVAALDGQARAVDGMVGVVVGTDSAFSVPEAAYAMVAVDQELIHDERYDDYVATYHSDLDCFLEQRCSRLEMTEDYTAHFILGVSSTNHTMNQYLWLDSEAGLALAHRAWLPEPPEVNFSWLAVDEQFYLDLFLPVANGHTRIQSTWMVYDQEMVTEDVILNLVISGMQQHSENLEDWLVAEAEQGEGR